MSKTVLYLYVCHQCLKECRQYIREDSENVQDELCGYDDLNDCEYNYQLDSVVEESDG